MSYSSPAAAAAAAAKLLQSCPTLCNPIDGSSPGSPVPGILQARTQVGCHFLVQCMKGKSESEVAQSCLTLSDPMDCSLPVSPSMGFSRREYWSGVPLPAPIQVLKNSYDLWLIDDSHHIDTISGFHTIGRPDG